MDSNEALLTKTPLLSTAIPPAWTTIFTPITSLSPVSRFLFLSLVISFILLNVGFFRLASVLSRDPVYRPESTPENPTHLLVVLGSGGHTAEMLNILSSYKGLRQEWKKRTYVVSSGDGFSALAAHGFEDEMALVERPNPENELNSSDYDIVTVHRARRVHQPLFTAPMSSLRCLRDCFSVLRGTHPEFQSYSQQTSYPDLILTNGPATGVILVLASIILLFFGFTGPSVSLPRSKKAANHASSSSAITTGKTGQMRTIYIESWARVKRLSLSGRLLKPFVDRFLVQWPQLAEGQVNDRKAEFVGSLVT